MVLMASSMSWPACSTGSIYRRAHEICPSLIPTTVTPAICRPVALQSHSFHTTSPSVLCLSPLASRVGEALEHARPVLVHLFLAPEPPVWVGRLLAPVIRVEAFDHRIGVMLVYGLT